MAEFGLNSVLLNFRASTDSFLHVWRYTEETENLSWGHILSGELYPYYSKLYCHILRYIHSYNILVSWAWNENELQSCYDTKVAARQECPQVFLTRRYCWATKEWQFAFFQEPTMFVITTLVPVILKCNVKYFLNNPKCRRHAVCSARISSLKTPSLLYPVSLEGPSV